jgi:WD40 repeat protein
VSCLVLLDEFHMASSSVDLTIKIWNLASGQVARTLANSFDPSFILLFPFGDGLLASHAHMADEAVTKGIVHLWNWQTGELTKTIQLEEGNLVGLVRLKKSTENLTISLGSTGSVKFLNI